MKNNLDDVFFQGYPHRRYRLRFRYERNGKKYKIDDDSPSWESMSPNHYRFSRSSSGKNYIESLLYRNVGRRWDDFYSEFCKKLKYQGDLRRDVLDLLKCSIELNILQYDDGTYGYVHRNSYRLEQGYDIFYVDPITNLICINKFATDREHGRKKIARKEYEEDKNNKFVRIDRYNHLEKDYDGTWYHYILKVIPAKIFIENPPEPEYYQQLVKTGYPEWKTLSHYEMERLGYSVHIPVYDYRGNDVHDRIGFIYHYERNMYRAIKKTPSHAVLKKAGVNQVRQD